MNIWTRGISDGVKRPVMFWCHGGGFTSLSGSSPGYDGTNLCMRCAGCGTISNSSAATRTELTYFAPDADFSMDEATMTERVRELVGADDAAEVISVYRAANPGASAAEINFLVASDASYVMPSITIAERRATLGGAATYLYYLTWRSPADDGRIMSPHTLDIPFIFDNVRINRLTQDSAEAIVLADRISDTIIEFARSGNPNVSKLPEWRPYDAMSRATMVWNNNSQVIDDPISRQREIMQPILQL